MLKRVPSDHEIQAKYQQLTPKQQGFVRALNAIALKETSVEALCQQMRETLTPQDYAQWVHEFNTFAHSHGLRNPKLCYTKELHRPSRSHCL